MENTKEEDIPDQALTKYINDELIRVEKEVNELKLKIRDIDYERALKLIDLEDSIDKLDQNINSDLIELNDLENQASLELNELMKETLEEIIV